MTQALLLDTQVSGAPNVISALSAVLKIFSDFSMPMKELKGHRTFCLTLNKRQVQDLQQKHTLIMDNYEDCSFVPPYLPCVLNYFTSGAITLLNTILLVGEISNPVLRLALSFISSFESRHLFSHYLCFSSLV